MSIAVACGCGANLKAPDTSSGKRVRCPKCRTALLVPAAEPDFEIVEDEPAPTLVVKTKVKPRLIDEEETRPVKKPRGADDDDPTPVKKVRRNRDDEGHSSERGKGERSRQKSNLPLLLGIGGGVFVLLAVVGVMVGVATSGGNPTPEQPKAELPAGWTRFQGEGFSVGLPPGAKVADKNGTSPVPYAVDGANWYGSAPDESKTSATGYVMDKYQLKPAIVTKVRQGDPAVWDELLKEWNGGAWANGSINKVTVAGAEGRTFSGDAGGAMALRVLVVVKGEHLYRLTYAGKTANEQVVKTFFDSFRFEK